jgi:murein DD-endopeptidase MepM/ murein hydrolase activator NlpD
MQFKVFGQNGRNVTRSAAILFLGALSAGCSSSAMRFDDFTDGMFTSSTTSNQSQITSRAENQPYPGSLAAPATGITQSALAPAPVSTPIQRSALAPAVGAAPASSPAAGSGLLPPPSRAVTQTASVPLPAASPAPKQPPAASSAPQGGGYTVVPGDTLFGIARKTGASAEAIKQANGLSNGFLRIGQRLTIPGAGSQQVASVSPAAADPAPTGAVAMANKTGIRPQPEPAAYTPPAKTERLVEQAALNPAEETPDSTGIGRMRWPVRGRVISAFGNSGGGKTNDGIDIAVPEGTPVKAAENGVVIYAGDGLKEFGNTVLVRHEDGLVTVYGHASEIKVARGDTVRRGQEIASSGMSGSAATPKLHFEVRKDSAPVDPSQFLE